MNQAFERQDTPAHAFGQPNSASSEKYRWPSHSRPPLHIQRLVVAQDVGSAIVGAVRADLFTGWGSWTAEVWVLWSRVPCG